MAKAKRKPLSFSTTMRNPARIAGFLECLLPFENKILTSDLITKVIKLVLNKKLYETMYQKKTHNLHEKFKSEEYQYTDAELVEIITKTPQKHKEAGFEYGWDSRFDTWYKLSKEFGFVYYKMNKPLQISKTGHMLIDAYKEIPPNEEKIQNVFLNAMMKYQSNNPFRRNLNSNVPLLLLLNVLSLLKNDPQEKGAGLFRQELSMLICWPDNDAQKLYQEIKKLRKSVGFNYSDEYMYEICLNILQATEGQRNYYKMTQICGEAVDEYIRKMRSTGIISLRGHGRFIDMNMLEKEKIDYVIANYSSYQSFDTCQAYYNYMGDVDSQVISIEKTLEVDISDIRKQTLYKYAKEYPEDTILLELRKVCNKQESSDAVLKFISAPTRLEFLTSIALVQQFKGLDVNPNYSVDDEGLPVFTAGGGIADIVCYDSDYDSLFEVTLMCGRQEQVNNEIIPIRRHLLDYKEKQPDTFSVFVAPIVHEDTKEIALWYKKRDNLDILVYDIEKFIIEISAKQRSSQLLNVFEEQ